MPSCKFCPRRMSLIFAIVIMIGSAQSATIRVSSNDSIQGAIDRAKDGDLIEVEHGTYLSDIDITVNKRLILKGIGNPIINASKNGNGITLSANGVVLEGFTIQSAKWDGINVISNDNTIEANIISNNINGIELLECSNNTLSNNTITKSVWTGVSLEHSSRNKFINNSLIKNCWGIVLKNSSHNYIKLNIVDGCERQSAIELA